MTLPWIVNAWCPHSTISQLCALVVLSIGMMMAASLCSAKAKLQSRGLIWWWPRIALLQTFRKVKAEMTKTVPWFSRSDPHRILLLGLDNAGKTTLCRALIKGSGWPTLQSRPEHHVLNYIFRSSDLDFNLIDPCHPVSHNSKQQGCCLKLWNDLLKSKLDGIIFVVDAADRQRLDQACSILDWTLQHHSSECLPVLVLGNKVDLPEAVSTWELKCRLGLAGLTARQRNALLGHSSGGLPFELRQRISTYHPNDAVSPPRPGLVEVRMCSIQRMWSVESGMSWLAQQIAISKGLRVDFLGNQPPNPRCCFSAMSIATQILVAFQSGSFLPRNTGLLPLFHA